MGSRFIRAFVVVLLALSLGTPWALLQSVAWVSMVVNYSRNASLAQAISQTFDGKHPCKLCRLIKQGQAQEREQHPQSTQPIQKLELALPPSLVVVFHPPVPCGTFQPKFVPETRSERPPTPPPRA